MWALQHKVPCVSFLHKVPCVSFPLFRIAHVVDTFQFRDILDNPEVEPFATSKFPHGAVPTGVVAGRRPTKKLQIYQKERPNLNMGVDRSTSWH